jgi:hypothetical protein
MQSIKDDAFTVCPDCGKPELFRVLHAPLHIQIVGEPTTLGQLAERNAKKMSAEEMKLAGSKFKTQKTISRIPDSERPASLPNEPAKESPEWIEKPRTKTHKQVSQMTPEQTKRYVQNGE